MSEPIRRWNVVGRLRAWMVERLLVDPAWRAGILGSAEKHAPEPSTLSSIKSIRLGAAYIGSRVVHPKPDRLVARYEEAGGIDPWALMAIVAPTEEVMDACGEQGGEHVVAGAYHLKGFASKGGEWPFVAGSAEKAVEYLVDELEQGTLSPYDAAAATERALSAHPGPIPAGLIDRLMDPSRGAVARFPGAFSGLAQVAVDKLPSRVSGEAMMTMLTGLLGKEDGAGFLEKLLAHPDLPEAGAQIILTATRSTSAARIVQQHRPELLEMKGIQRALLLIKDPDVVREAAARLGLSGPEVFDEIMTMDGNASRDSAAQEHPKWLMDACLHRAALQLIESGYLEAWELSESQIARLLASTDKATREQAVTLIGERAAGSTEGQGRGGRGPSSVDQEASHAAQARQRTEEGDTQGGARNRGAKEVEEGRPEDEMVRRTGRR